MRRTNRPSYRRLQGTRLDSSKSIVNSEVRGKINHRERGTRDDSPKSIESESESELKMMRFGSFNFYETFICFRDDLRLK